MIEFEGQESEKSHEMTDDFRMQKSRRLGPPVATRTRQRPKRTTYTGGISRRRNRRWAW